MILDKKWTHSLNFLDTRNCLAKNVFISSQIKFELNWSTWFRQKHSCWQRKIRNHSSAFQITAVPEAWDVKNRCNLRLLSIFQITDKHVVDDCSQTGGPLRRNCQNNSRWENCREWSPFTNESSSHWERRRRGVQTHPSHGHRLTLGFESGL